MHFVFATQISHGYISQLMLSYFQYFLKDVNDIITSVYICLPL